MAEKKAAKKTVKKAESKTKKTAKKATPKKAESKTKKTAKKATPKATKSKTASKSKAKSKKKATKEPPMGDMGIVIVDDDIEIDQEKVNEERRAYLEEARSQEAFD